MAEDGKNGRGKCLSDEPLVIDEDRPERQDSQTAHNEKENMGNLDIYEFLAALREEVKLERHKRSHDTK